MKSRSKRLLAFLCSVALIWSSIPAVSAQTVADSASFAVLSTTDIHGKVWSQNILNDSSVSNSLLRVSSAVQETREAYGDNVLLIDNGDLYQGTPVSSYHIAQLTQYLNDGSTDNVDPAFVGEDGSFNTVNPMALALKQIGYDASVLGNHEFNYSWNTMNSIYDYLGTDDEDGAAVPVLAGNLHWTESIGDELAGENVFAPYTVKELDVGGETVRVGIIGIENTDCPRWDVPDNYPNISFAHPTENPGLDMALETAGYVETLRTAEACDFVILAFHSGIGSNTAGTDLTFGVNTENQAHRVIASTTGIDLVITGHDHSTSYSNSRYENADGEEVLVVNGGGTTLTKSIFTVEKTADGFDFSVDSSENLNLSGYEDDADLAAKIQPYVEPAAGYIGQTVGVLSGEWNHRTTAESYLNQSDTVDLINRAQMDKGSYYIAQKFEGVDPADVDVGDRAPLTDLKIDVSSTSIALNNNYNAVPGELTMKDIYGFYRFDNALYALPMSGQEILDILEWNAENRLDGRVVNGQPVYSAIGDSFTNPVFYGLDFSYDMYEAPGSRVKITGFSDGRPFDLAATYILAVNNYHLGNGPFAAYSTGDALWSQTDDMGGGIVQDLIAEFVADAGEEGISPSPSGWSLTWSGDLETNLDDAVAIAHPMAALPEDGDLVYFYYNAGNAVVSDTFKIADSVLQDNVLYPTQTTAAAFTVGVSEEGYTFQNAAGAYLNTTGGLGFGETLDKTAYWMPEATENGYFIKNIASEEYLEYYGGSFTTYGMGSDTSIYTYNFYKAVPIGAKLTEAPKDGGSVLIYYPQGGLLVSNLSADNTNEGAKDRLGEVAANAAGSLIPVYENTGVFAVRHDEATGYYNFVSDGKYLTSGPEGNVLGMTAAPGENNLSDWELEAAGDSWFIHNVGASYGGSNNQYMEYYYGFTTYGKTDSSDPGIYTFDFYSFEGDPDAPTPPPVEPDEEHYVLPLFETTDVHGFMMDVSSGNPETYQYRMAYIANVVNEKRKGNPDTTLLLDTGDIYQGNVITNLQEGRPMIATFDAMGYDAVGLGNHEFDWGVEVVADPDATMSSYTAPEGTEVDSQIPILASNVYDAETDTRVDFTRDYEIFTKTAVNAAGETKEVKIGVVGFVPDYRLDIMPARIAPYVLKDDIAIPEAIGKALKDSGEVDALILLAHEGAARCVGRLAEDTVFDLVLGGHSHQNATGVNANNGVTYLQTNNMAQNYGYAELRFNDGEVTIAENAVTSVTADRSLLYEDSEALDPEVLALSKHFYGVVEEKITEVLGYVVEDITKGGIGDNPASSTAGNWMNGALMRATDSDVGFTNNGGIRTEYPLNGAEQRSITLGDVYTMAPFSNVVYVYEASYADFLDLATDFLRTNLDIRLTGVEVYYTGNIGNDGDAEINAIVKDGTAIYTDGEWVGDWAEKTLRMVTQNYVGTSLEMLVEWNADGRLVDNVLTDNEAFVEALREESAENDGLLAVDTTPYLVAGVYEPTDPPAPDKVFEDVQDPDEWFYAPVYYVYGNDIMAGISEELFAPRMVMTRAMIVQALYNLEGKPEVEVSSFKDLQEGAWYVDAVSWGEATGVVSGYTDHLFRPNQSCSREEMAVIFRNYFDYAGADLTATPTEYDFEDMDQVSSWAKEAIEDMLRAGIINGMDNNKLEPKGTANRAQLAAIFMNSADLLPVVTD